MMIIKDTQFGGYIENDTKEYKNSCAIYIYIYKTKSENLVNLLSIY